MKLRNGFVSNSSCSSFVVCARDLTDTQIAAIYKHCDIAVLMTMNDTKEKSLEELVIYANLADSGDVREEFFGEESTEGCISERFGWYDPWGITFDEERGEIRGFTVVDNFNMSEFFKAIGASSAKIDEDDFR